MDAHDIGARSIWRARRSHVNSLLNRKGTERTACLRCVLASWRPGVEEWMGVGCAVVVLNAKAQRRNDAKDGERQRPEPRKTRKERQGFVSCEAAKARRKQ